MDWADKEQQILQDKKSIKEFFALGLMQLIELESSEECYYLLINHLIKFLNGEPHEEIVKIFCEWHRKTNPDEWGND